MEIPPIGASTKRITLTDAKLKHLKPKASVYEVADAGAPGLRVRIYPTGRKVFRWVRPLGDGKTRAVTLGGYGTNDGELSLARARRQLEELKTAHMEARLHGDPLSGAAGVSTVHDLAEIFYSDRLETQRKHPKEARSILDRHIIKHLGRRKVASLPASAVSTMITRIVNDGAPVHAGKVLGLTKQMLNFGVARGYLSHNPAAGLRPIDLGVQKHKTGDRYLTGEEIGLFYQALGQAPRMSEQTRIAFKILLLTGARTNELLQARWDHVDLDRARWVLPPENQKLTLRSAKTARDFVIPLASQSVALFRLLKAMAGKSAWVMASLDSDIGHYSDKSLGLALRRLFNLRAEGEDNVMRHILTIPHFTPHDLRRTCRTHLTDTLNVQPHVAEKYLGHSLGTLEKVYDKGQLLDQRLEAACLWGDYVDQVTGQAADNGRGRPA
jgi:integrase